jgi:hypothetical protein
LSLASCAIFINYHLAVARVVTGKLPTQFTYALAPEEMNKDNPEILGFIKNNFQQIKSPFMMNSSVSAAGTTTPNHPTIPKRGGSHPTRICLAMKTR